MWIIVKVIKYIIVIIRMIKAMSAWMLVVINVEHAARENIIFVLYWFMHVSVRGSSRFAIDEGLTTVLLFVRRRSVVHRRVVVKYVIKVIKIIIAVNWTAVWWIAVMSYGIIVGVSLKNVLFIRVIIVFVDFF